MTTTVAVYAGLRNYPQGLHHVWEKLESGELIGKCLTFKKCKSKSSLQRSFIGEVWEIEETDNTCKPVKSLKPFDDKSKLSEWRLEHQAAELEVANSKEASKSADIGNMTLLEFKAKYHNLIGHTRRTAMLLSLYEYVTG